MLEKKGGRVWIGLIWLKVDTGYVLLLTPYWSFEFHKRLGICWLAYWLSAHKGLRSMELVYLEIILYWVLAKLLGEEGFCLIQIVF
jgi:hypothetical protein